ncbi:YphA family membrane protein [Chengkuizengella marina]
MNPGYLSFLLLCITCILLFFGWKNQIIQEVSRRTILLFLMLWTFFLFINIPFAGGYIVNLSYLFMVITSVYVTYRFQIVTLNFFLYFIFISTLYVLFQMLYFIDPMFIIYHPKVDIAVVLALLSASLIKNSLEQFAAITLGMIFGDIILSLFIFHKSPLQLGTFELYDMWLLTFITCRVISEVVNRGYQGLKQYFVKIKN